MSRLCVALIMTGMLLPSLLFGPEARADGVVSDAEFAYIQTYGASAVCPTLDRFPSEAGVMGIASGIMDDGFAPDSAVDIINASVSNFCPKYWPLLQAIGAQARAEHGGYVL